MNSRVTHPQGAFDPAPWIRILGTMLLLSGVSSNAVPAHAERVPSERRAEILRNETMIERQDDLPAQPATATSTASIITFGRFTSIQVNVDAIGLNIVGDAANEPSLAVNPLNHNRMVIGWRQFDSISSSFRQAGVGYSSDGGLTWTASKLEPGIFRSDPVLAADGALFYYNSLSTASGLTTQVFRTSDGTTWQPGVFAYGGDKTWMYVDPDFNNIYQAWSTASNLYEPNTFNVSLDQGDTYHPPSEIPSSPVWGTLDAATDWTLYMVGWGDGVACDLCVGRSADAHRSDANPPTFTMFPIDLGGFLKTGPPNPAGVLGQLWIAVDHSTGPRAGWLYVLASVVTPTDPLDVNFIRSADRGQTWSAPVRVNDDATGTRAYQWFGTMSVSPSGRIDAVWNDTRGSADSTVSALYYSYSTNGGFSWAAAEQASPTWSSSVGWPVQQKIGDYYHMVSDDAGADLAYSATFNGGQDVYYLRIPNSARGVDVDQAGPRPGRLLASEPNPFVTSTSIRFDASSTGARFRLAIYDVHGRRVATLLDRFVRGPGQSVSWDGRLDSGSPAAPGVYLCRLESGGHAETRKLLRLR